MREKAREGTLKAVNGSSTSSAIAGAGDAAAAPKKRRRWDQTADDTPSSKQAKKTSSWDAAETAGTPSNSRWDETPGRSKGAETPSATPGQSTRMWEATPGHATPGAVTPGRDTPGHATPGGHQGTPSARKNRWDETPKTDRGTPIRLLSETYRLGQALRNNNTQNDNKNDKFRPIC